MQRSQTQSQIHRMDTDDLAVGEQVVQSTQSDPIGRVVERGDQHK